MANETSLNTSEQPTFPAQVHVRRLRLHLTRINQRSSIVWMVSLLMLLSACTSAPTATASPTPNPSPSPSAPVSTSDCTVRGQTPPSGDIGADFATALAFAPDGRLFWTERSGAVKVWQDGAARTFATVTPDTSGERG